MMESYASLNNKVTLECTGAAIDTISQCLILVIRTNDDMPKETVLEYCRNSDYTSKIDAHLVTTVTRDETYEGYSKFKMCIDNGSDVLQIYLAQPDVASRIEELKALIESLKAGE